FSPIAAIALHDEGRVPTSPPRPYDARRDLPVPGEGSVALVLETRQSAESRGAKVLAEVGAWSMAFEPLARGGKLERAGSRSVAGALAMEAVRPDAIGALFTSAPGDKLLDAAEALGLREALGPALEGIPACAVKGAVGEWEGASGAVQAL